MYLLRTIPDKNDICPGMFLLCGVRLLTERFVAYRTARQQRSLALVNSSLRGHQA
jgi:hypothetical protein